jgi:hypothetical protein
MRPQLEALGDKLLRAGVAPRHVSRYLRELSEHLEDLIAAEERAGNERDLAEKLALARLGQLDDLAKAMIAQKRFRSWSSRAPWAVFLLAPFLAVLCGLIVTVLLMVVPSRTVIVNPTHAYNLVPDWYGSFIALIAAFNQWVLPQMLAWAITTVAIKQRTRPVWPILGFMVAAILCGSQSYQINWLHAPNQFSNVAITTPFLQFGRTWPVVGAAMRVLVNFGIMATLYSVWSRRRAFAK